MDLNYCVVILNLLELHHKKTFDVRRTVAGLQAALGRCQTCQTLMLLYTHWCCLSTVSAIMIMILYITDSVSTHNDTHLHWFLLTLLQECEGSLQTYFQ